MRRLIQPILLAVTLGCLGSLTVLQAQPTGQWDFDSGDLSATVGQPMTYADPTATAAGTTFGTTTSLGIPDIDGTPALVMGFQEFSLGEGYYMPTPAANGGGSLVNIWTLVMDVLYPAASDGRWRAIIDIDEGFIAEDADFFVNTANGIGISGDYTGQILPDTWHRVAITMDSTTGEMRKYIDGEEVGVQNLGDVFEGRWALSANHRAELFADNDGDVAPGYVNSVQLRDTVLSPGEIYALGGPSADGIPQTIPSTTSFIESRTPAVDAIDVSPTPQVDIVLNTGSSTVAQSSIVLSIDAAVVTATVTPSGQLYDISYQVAAVLEPRSVHTLKLDWTDSVAGARSESWSFTVADFSMVNLPEPVFLENFDAVIEGEMPTGWSVTNLTDQLTPGFDLANAQSDSYMDFVVINVDTLSALNVDSDRRFALSPIVLNGEVLSSLVSGNFAYGESDVRGGNQVEVMTSPDYDLTGQNNVFLAWHSMYEQNQDNLAAVEYSIDGGATWLPVLYMVDGPDIIIAGEQVDAVATLTTARDDQAYGEAYGTWIEAEITQDLAPYISGRVNDDNLESKRVELHRLEMADNQSQVRVRFVHAGTSSWYFGIDEVGLYSIDAPIPPSISSEPVSQWVHVGGSVTLSVSAAGTEPFSYQWMQNEVNIPGATDATYTIDSAQVGDAGSYKVVVSNAGGSDTGAANVSVFAGAIADQLVVHLKLDNDVTDSSGAGNDGQTEGNPTFVTGLIGTHAANIASGLDYVSLGTPIDLDFGINTDFSASFWAKCPEAGWTGDPAFLSNKAWASGGNPGYVIATDGDGRVQWNLAGAPGGRKDFDGPGGVLGNDDWHHVVVTFDRDGTAATYVDGAVINLTDLTESENNVSTPGGNATNVGNDGSGAYGSGSFSDLSVDDLGIWRRVLTPQEVAAIRDAGLLGQDLSTVVIEVALPPEVTGIDLDQGSVTISWTADPNTQLQKASTVSGGTWTNVDGTLGQGSHTEAVGGGNVYYRLSQGQ